MDNYFGNICYCRRCNGVVHTIKKGDTLYLISKYYRVPIGEIMAANRNLNIYNLQIGEEICIPIRRPEPVTPADNMQNTGNNFGDLYSNEGISGNNEGMMQNMNSVDIEPETETFMGDSTDNTMEMRSSADNMIKQGDLERDSSNMTLAELINNSDMTLDDLIKKIKNQL